MPKIFLKLIVSISIFALVLSRIDIRAVGHAIAGANVLFLGLALLLALAMIVTDAAFLQSVLGSLGHRFSFGTAILYSFSGAFFGALGLAWTGADIFRAAQLRRVGIGTETAIRAVVTTRLMSFVSLLAVIACGLPIVLSYPLQPRDKLLLISFVAIALGGIIAFLVIGPARNQFPLLRVPALLERVAGVSSDLVKALSSKRYSFLSLLFSTSTHLVRVSVFAAIAAALHAEIKFAALYALVPISLLVAMIPIAIGSWGVREASVIFFLGQIGVPAAMALSISVAYGIIVLIVDALGGFVWIFSRSHHYQLAVVNAPDNDAPTEHGSSAAAR
jgi:glycosyltransferase 2 family protein